MKSLALAVFVCLLAAPAFAQTQTAPVPQCQYQPSAVQGGTPSSCGQIVGYIDGSGKFQQIDSTHPMPTTPSGSSSTVTATQGEPNAGTTHSWWMQIYNSIVGVQDSHGTQLDFTLPTLTIPTSQYPNGATPITGNATGTTGAVVGTLSGTGGKTTYICGFDVSAIGGTATIGPITVAGLKTTSAVYQLASTAGGVTMARSFSPCIPASATNTAITITTTADGTATAVDVNSYGYQL